MRTRGFLLAAAAVIGSASGSGAEATGARFRLEGGTPTAGGGLLRGGSGLTLYGAFEGPVASAVLRGPTSGRRLEAGFPAVGFRPFTDADADGVADAADDCVFVADPLQRDSDGDGFGNACDADFDNDGVVGFSDLARLRGAFFSRTPDFDLDGDGVVSFGDLARLRASMFRPPGPSGLRR